MSLFCIYLKKINLNYRTFAAYLSLSPFISLYCLHTLLRDFAFKFKLFPLFLLLEFTNVILSIVLTKMFQTSNLPPALSQNSITVSQSEDRHLRWSRHLLQLVRRQWGRKEIRGGSRNTMLWFAQPLFSPRTSLNSLRNCVKFQYDCNISMFHWASESQAGMVLYSNALKLAHQCYCYNLWATRWRSG